MTEESGSDRDAGRSAWTAAQSGAIARSADTVAPVIRPPETDPAESVHVWDTWLLRDRNGGMATVDGYRVAFSLTATSELLPGKRHDVAEIRYFYSPDGRRWHDGGRPASRSTVSRRRRGACPGAGRTSP